jgi:hypothetical protein
VPVGGQWAHHLVRAEHRLALPFAERMQQRGQAQHDSVAVLLGRFYDGISRLFLGEFNAAHALFEQCHELRELSLREAVSKMLAEDSYSLMLGYSSAALVSLGYLNQARVRADEGLLEARRLRHVHTLVFCLWLKCWTKSIANMMQQERGDNSALRPTDRLSCAEAWLPSLGSICRQRRRRYHEFAAALDPGIARSGGRCRGPLRQRQLRRRSRNSRRQLLADGFGAGKRVGSSRVGAT